MTASLAALVLLLALAPGLDELSRPGTGGGPSLRWAERSGRVVAEVVGIGGADGPRADLLTVRVARPGGGPEAAAMAGRVEVAGGVLRITPRYSLLPGTRYVARFRPADGPPVEAVYETPAGPARPPTAIVAVYPTADRVPENLLKVYLHFSGPMARGEAYRRVRLVEAGGRPLERPFLEIGEELWSVDGMRLTLLFDPGRVKRGLIPREEEGPILEAGKAYRLVVDAGWPDASGRPLAAGLRKEFRAGPADDGQPAPSKWTFEVPRPGTRDPLVVTFPEPLDHAMLGRVLRVEASGTRVGGRVEVGHGETSWRFIPGSPWPPGPLALRVDSELEDLAGNSIARPFEVDVVRAPGSATTPATVVVPVPRR